MSEALRKCSHKLNIFLIPVSISELTSCHNFFGTVLPLDGARIPFFKDWNSKLKGFFGESF